MAESIYRKLFYVSACLSVLIAVTCVLYTKWHNSQLSKFVKTKSAPTDTPAAAQSRMDSASAILSPEYPDSTSSTPATEDDLSAPETDQPPVKPYTYIFPDDHQFFPGMTLEEALYEYDNVIKPETERRYQKALRENALAEKRVAEEREKLARAQAQAYKETQARKARGEWYELPDDYSPEKDLADHTPNPK